MAVIGNFLALYIGGQRVALATSNNFSLGTDMADTSNKDDAGYSSAKPVKNTFTCDIEGIYTSAIGNALQFPEDLTNPAWVKTGCSISSTKQPNPVGQLQAQRVTGLSGTDTVTQTIAALGTSGQYIVFSVWLKGSGTITIKCGDTTGAQTQLITLTNQLTRYYVSCILDSATGVYATLEAGTATQVDVYGPQLELGDTPGDYIGSAYLVRQLQTAQNNATELTIRHSTDLNGDFQIAGQAHITNVQYKAAANDVVKFTASLNGTGTQAVSNV